MGTRGNHAHNTSEGEGEKRLGNEFLAKRGTIRGYREISLSKLDPTVS